MAFLWGGTWFNARMNVGPSIWDKLTRVVMVCLLVAAGIGIVLWYRPVVKQNEQVRRDKLRLEKEIEREKEIDKTLSASIKALQDPRTIERLAREKLSYAKPGENVIHFDPPATSTNSTRLN